MARAQQMHLVPITALIPEAIAYLRKHEPLEGYFVGFSGGKDSIVTLELVRMSGVRHQAYYSRTGIDPPEVVRFIERHYPDVIHLRPKMTFWEGIQKNHAPLRTQRWCCNVLKKNPSKHIPLKHRVMGIRGEESFKRASRPRNDWNKKLKLWVHKPIFHWLEWHIWEFIKTYNLPYPSLYDEGFHRIGCVVCPFLPSNNMKRIEQHKARWPGFYKAFEHAVTRWWNTNRAKPWFDASSYKDKSPEEYIEMWYRGLF